MISYVKKASGCRSQHIANYFTDVKINACGICDNCINEKVIYISADEFSKISDQIITLIKVSPVSVNEIIGSHKGIKKEKVWRVIDYLQSENKIKTGKEGNIRLV